MTFIINSYWQGEEAVEHLNAIDAIGVRAWLDVILHATNLEEGETIVSVPWGMASFCIFEETAGADILRVHIDSGGLGVGISTETA